MIYVASSWRNEIQPMVVKFIKEIGEEVYDFKDPANAFHWSEIDEGWNTWAPYQMRDVIMNNPLAEKAYDADYGALVKADTCIMVLPCGASAHLELGIAAGMKKRTAIFLYEGAPTLMYRGIEMLCSWDDLYDFVETIVTEES